MIWFRRIVAVPLSLVFIVLFVLLLVVHRVNATAGNPDFYIDQLRQNDVYNFMYHDILPAALDEIKIEEDTSKVPFDIDEIKSQAPGTIEEAVPPEWIQAQVEQVISQVLPYILGGTDSFTVRISLNDRVEAVAAAVKDLLRDEKFFTDMYDQGIQFGVDQYQEMEDLPSFLQMSDNEVASMLRSVLPADWIQSQVDANIDEIVPYITRESENFTLRIDVSGRMDALESAITDILMKPAAHDYMVNELFVPYIQEKIKDMGIPGDITFTDSEIAAVVEEVLPPGWYEARVNDIAGQVFAYLNGTAAGINIVVPLAELRPATIAAFVNLADRKLESVVNSLPIGTAEQVADLLAHPPVGSLPSYRPPDMSYTAFKTLCSIDVASLVTSSVDEWIPDQYVLTDADIHEELTKGGGEDILTQARDVVQDGLTYTDADLRKDMKADDLKTIDDARQYIATDYTFTEADLQKFITKSDDPSAAETWQSLQDVRSVVGTARTWVWPAWLIPALLLVGIAYLGGRGWKSRVVWGASVLAIACLIVYVASGPVFSALAKPQIDDAIVKAVGQQSSAVGTIAADKGISVAENTVDSFISGISIEAIVLFVLCLVVIAVVVWHPWSRGRESIQETMPPADLPPADQPQNPPDSPTG